MLFFDISMEFWLEFDNFMVAAARMMGPISSCETKMDRCSVVLATVGATGGFGDHYRCSSHERLIIFACMDK